MESKPPFVSELELASFVTGFENGTLPASQWTHAAHVAVAGWYLSRSPSPADALDALRQRIRSYNDMTGSPNTQARGYHETLTVFWVRVLHRAMEGQDVSMPLHERINELVDRFGGASGLWKEYYSFNVIRSREARARWMEPDLRPLQ
jgi:hypothetical protein